MSSLALLVVFLFILVTLILVGGVTYVARQHPSVVGPLTLACGVMGVMVSCVGVIVAR
ncbi:hypothetical protein [Streptomyces europaeiscabiei]|uniref:hypothetical protein n=1 Tax=Streptomyces europaeiscabiei TaxID=146819 RepID=UPI002E13BF73|nr:hypothetical protein OHB30_10980 [Streptomyces europaeiscabiei]